MTISRTVYTRGRPDNKSVLLFLSEGYDDRATNNKLLTEMTQRNRASSDTVLCLLKMFV